MPADDRAELELGRQIAARRVGRGGGLLGTVVLALVPLRMFEALQWLLPFAIVVIYMVVSTVAGAGLLGVGAAQWRQANRKLREHDRDRLPAARIVRELAGPRVD